MSWNLLSFSVPAFGLFNVFARINPASYKKFDETPESDQAVKVNAIVERVLNAENVPGSEHFERIQDMLQELPDSAGPKTIQSLIRCRFKVIKTEADDFPAFATGTDARDGKYYIGLKVDTEIERALSWIITHELSHILNDDPLQTSIFKTIGSLASASLSTFVLGLSLLPSLAALFLTTSLTHIICSQRGERAADDFAVKHCSRQELEEGIAVLALVKIRRAQGVYTNNPLLLMLHPSENSRIAKIRSALQLTREASPT